jgi:hypothetical protein
MVQEAIHSSGQRGMIIKISMENTFDKVWHYFILDIMHKFGFCSSFIHRISACICNPWISPLMNGILITFFKGSTGLHQGLPLVPLLYIIMVESLSRKLEAER